MINPPYSKEDCLLLINMVRDVYASMNQTNNTPNLVNYLVAYVADEPLPFISHRCKRTFFESPLSQMPLLIAHKDPLKRTIAKWRLYISK